jgi:hypothetical protein
MQCSIASECESENEENVKLFISVQPELYEKDDDILASSSFYFNICCGIASLILILFLISSHNSKKLLASLDLYSLNHNYEVGKAMYIRKTLLGGLFSIIFIFISLSLVFSSTITFILDNIVETQTLVPLVTIEQDYKNVISI